MNFNDYQDKAADFAVYETLDYPLLALGEEVGELQGKVAKHVRKNRVSANDALFHAGVAFTDESQELREDLIKEAGDVLWNLSNLLNDLNVPLETVARMNIGKLESRKKRNVIVGEGDNR